MQTAQNPAYNDYLEAARRFIAYGHRYGFLYAEAVLMDYLPQGKESGQVKDIPHAQLAAFTAALENPPRRTLAAERVLSAPDAHKVEAFNRWAAGVLDD